jgi:hypothetical protein
MGTACFPIDLPVFNNIMEDFFIQTIFKPDHCPFPIIRMKELEDIYRIHKTNKKVLPKLLELLDRRMKEIDERVASLKKLKTEIMSYKQKIEEKLNEE